MGILSTKESRERDEEENENELPQSAPKKEKKDGDEEWFWSIIDKVADANVEEKAELLKDALEGLNEDELQTFDREFGSRLDESYSWKLWGAAYLIGGGCSDDAFMDFRAALISRGRDVFVKALADPDSLEEFAEEEEDWFLEEFLYVAQQVAEAKGWTLPERDLAASEPFGDKWEEDDLPRILPRLSNKMESLEWSHVASDKVQVLDNGKTLRLWPPAKQDYWQRTFYKPLLVKDDGPVALVWRPSHEKVAVQVHMKLTRAPGAQFDQGGLFVRIDEGHWIKTGLEVVDEKPRLSCVTTNASYSDWSTQVWPDFQVFVRVSQIGDGSFVVEAKHAEQDPWMLVRICQLHKQSPKVGLGLFGCCPAEQRGCSVDFSHYSVQDVDFHHHADECA